MVSDGILIISHGELTGGSEYSRQMAEKCGKHWMHIDPNKPSVEAAVQVIRAWIDGSQIKTLNVAGPRASRDPKIYGITRRLLSVLIRMMSMGSQESEDLPG
jgi:hypothetical protein